MERTGIFATAKLKKVLLNFVSAAGSQGWDNIHFSLAVVLYIHKIVPDPGHIQSLSCPDLR